MLDVLAVVVFAALVAGAVLTAPPVRWLAAAGAVVVGLFLAGLLPR